jgi:hypothetical protein
MTGSASMETTQLECQPIRTSVSIRWVPPPEGSNSCCKFRCSRPSGSAVAASPGSLSPSSSTRSHQMALGALTMVEVIGQAGVCNCSTSTSENPADVSLRRHEPSPMTAGAPRFPAPLPRTAGRTRQPQHLQVATTLEGGEQFPGLSLELAEIWAA